MPTFKHNCNCNWSNSGWHGLVYQICDLAFSNWIYKQRVLRLSLLCLLIALSNTLTGLLYMIIFSYTTSLPKHVNVKSEQRNVTRFVIEYSRTTALSIHKSNRKERSVAVMNASRLVKSTGKLFTNKHVVSNHDRTLLGKIT